MIPYARMKGELEEAVKGLGFEKTVILRPGLIVGDRGESRPAEFVIRKIAGVAGMLGNWAKDGWAQVSFMQGVGCYLLICGTG